MEWLCKYGSDIKNKIESLVNKSQTPILKDLHIQDNILNNKYIALYPLNGKICDIFLGGQPIIISVGIKIMNYHKYY